MDEPALERADAQVNALGSEARMTPEDRPRAIQLERRQGGRGTRSGRGRAVYPELAQVYDEVQAA